MVAQKKGRGAKTPAKAAKPAVQPEEQVQADETSEMMEAEENNGEVEQSEQTNEGTGTAETGEGNTEEQNQEGTDEGAKTEEKPEEKVESGKLLVENLPSSYLFDYQEKLKELFSKHGEITGVKRGPIIVTELTTTPTLSAIVEFKNKESLDKALLEDGTVVDGNAISVAVESRAETAVLVGVPYEASTDYVKLLFAQCGEVSHIHEFSKTKYKILRVTFHEKESVERALKLDRELRVNGFLVTVNKYRDDDEQKAHAANSNKNKRQHSQQQQNRNNASANANASTNSSPSGNRSNNSFRARGSNFNARGNFRVVDASGRYHAGVLNGNRFWLGSKEECQNLDKNFIDDQPNESSDSQNTIYAIASRRNEKYFDDGEHDWKWMPNHGVITHPFISDNQPPISLAYSTAELALNITKVSMTKFYEIILGVCLPRSCSYNDIESLINFSIMINDNLKSNKTLPRKVRLITLRLLDTYHTESDVGAITLIVITVLLVLLTVAATSYDLDLTKFLPYGKQSRTFDLEKFNKPDIRGANLGKKVYNKDERMDNEKVGLKFSKRDDTVATNVISDDKGNVEMLTAKKYNEQLPDPVGMDVIPIDVNTGNCKRCGKYKKQCDNARRMDNLSVCPRIKYDFYTNSTVDEKWKDVFCRLFLCFSLVYSWRRIFNKNTANKDLALMHGFKIIATFLIIFVHVSVMVNSISGNTRDVNERNNIYYALALGTIAFDVLFFVSGLFSSHHFFYLKSRYSVEELVNFGGVCGQILLVICFVTNRIIRLLPSYGYAILLSAVVARVFHSTAVLALPDGDHTHCDSYWWRNLLFISNMYSGERQCMQISWYLSTETQLHAVGALACAASLSSNMFASMRARLVAMLAFVVLLAATATDIMASYIDDGLLFSNAHAAYSSLIERPLARVAPYFIGVFTGWLVHSVNGRLKVSKITSCVLWMTSLSVATLCGALAQVRPWLWSCAHACCALALLWPALICSSNYAGFFREILGSRTFSGLSRLCYGMLLLHVVVARTLLLGMDSSPCSYTLCIWMYYTGTCVLTVLGALLLALLVEMPCCSLLRRLSDWSVTV